MAQNEITDFNPVNNDNTDLAGTTVQQNQMYPYHVDNAFRNLMGMIGRWTDFGTIASAGTTSIGGQPEAYLNVTGTTTITGFGTVREGTIRFLKFAGALTLTHNATTLILPGGANITTAAGDVAVMVSEGSGNWRCLSYQRASGQALVVPPAGAGKLDVRRNRVVNHDMRMSQENGTTAGTTNGRYPVDQWAQYFVTSAGVLTVAQVASVTPAGSPNRLRATVTTADASLAAGEYWTISQNLEGSNVADFKYGAAGAFSSVLRFGFRGPAGTYGVALHNGGVNRSFVAMFTIGAGQANTDTFQTVSIPGDVTGTWLTADGVIGLTLDIVLAAGTTFQGVAGWQSGNILATNAISNGMGTGGAVFELFDVGLRLDPDATGVYGQYEVGEVHAVWRSERYWESSYSRGTAIGTATFVGAYFLQQTSGTRPLVSPAFAFEKCKASATIVIYNPQTGATGSLYNQDAASSYATAFDYVASTKSFEVRPATGVSGAAAFHWTANARI